MKINKIKLALITLFILIIFGIISWLFSLESTQQNNQKFQDEDTRLNEELEKDFFAEENDLPMTSIETLREKNYSGSKLTIERELANGTNYKQYITSYKSENDIKIYGLLTIPLEEKPEEGYPAIIFVHGYIPPKQYSTTDSYPTYQATLARSGFVTFKPDLRGRGDSEGEASSAHFSQDYVIDTLYAVSSLQKHKDVDPERIGYWGHSNGGEIGLRVAVISDDIKAYSLWAGVVGSFEDMLETYNDQIPFLQNLEENELIKKYGKPSENPETWKKVDPHFHLESISAPIELHHGTEDNSVPIELSISLRDALRNKTKAVSFFEYENDNHNISQNSSLAWQRTIVFFQEEL